MTFRVDYTLAYVKAGVVPKLESNLKELLQNAYTAHYDHEAEDRLEFNANQAIITYFFLDSLIKSFLTVPYFQEKKEDDLIHEFKRYAIIAVKLFEQDETLLPLGMDEALINRNLRLYCEDGAVESIYKHHKSKI